MVCKSNSLPESSLVAFFLNVFAGGLIRTSWSLKNLFALVFLNLLTKNGEDGKLSVKKNLKL